MHCYDFNSQRFYFTKNLEVYYFHLDTVTTQLYNLYGSTQGQHLIKILVNACESLQKMPTSIHSLIRYYLLASQQHQVAERELQKLQHFSDLHPHMPMSDKINYLYCLIKAFEIKMYAFKKLMHDPMIMQLIADIGYLFHHLSEGEVFLMMYSG